MTTRLLSILLLCLALSWPALRNGQPFLLSDTTTYVRGADAAAYKLIGWRTAWTGTFISRYESGPHPHVAQPGPMQAATPVDPASLPVTLAGRSIFYGLLLYLSVLIGGFWPAAIFQILITATAIILATEAIGRAFGQRLSLKASLAMAFVTALSPAGYFAAYMMPDIFLPLAVLAFCQISLLWPLLGARERAFWIALLAAGMLFHNLHLVIVMGAFIIWVALKGPVLLQRDRQPATVIVTAILAAFAGQWAFDRMVTQATGTPPVTVPFATARVIADGPGRAYLMTHCPQAPFRLCHYLDRLRTNSDTFLWSHDPRVGVFSAIPPQDRRLISTQQAAFVVAVAHDNPRAAAQSTIASIVLQSGKWGLPEFNYSPFLRSNFRVKLPAPALPDVAGSAAFQERMPVALVELTTPLLVIATLPLLVSAFQRTRRPEPHRTILFYAVILCGTIIANIVLCGGISTPHDRYLMRLIWLLPVIGVAIGSAVFQTRKAVTA